MQKVNVIKCEASEADSTEALPDIPASNPVSQSSITTFETYPYTCRHTDSNKVPHLCHLFHFLP
ncbi:hypothetical protein LDENG_00267290 [Lucifuga dentata]|nr:hypothetical protein LDENG_00267290 [Lucifuga dentata]